MNSILRDNLLTEKEIDINGNLYYVCLFYSSSLSMSVFISDLFINHKEDILKEKIILKKFNFNKKENSLECYFEKQKKIKI